MNSPASFVEEIVNVTRKMRTVFDNMAKERGLSLARARILKTLGGSDCGASQRMLADELEVEGPTLVRLLDNLEKLGCIKRVSVESDRRTKQIVLTEQGRQKAAEIEDVGKGFRTKMLAGVDPGELDVALRVITQVSANLDAIG